MDAASRRSPADSGVQITNGGGSYGSSNSDSYGSSGVDPIVHVLPIPASGKAGDGMGGRRKGRLPVARRFAYGVGHVFNDMCASMWFTYLLVFYHMVVHIPNTQAGTLLLIGQVADALATPVVGYLCDITRCRYGRRKIWHLVGTILVALSLFFFWHRCLPCNYRTHIALKMLYYSVFIIMFQWGWAMVQISHLSLIPELTEDENERVGLNAIRYSFTILANVGVFCVMFLLLKFIGRTDGTSSEALTKSDEWIFSGTALGIVAVGLVFSGIFHIGTREPSTSAEQKLEKAEGRKIPWFKWFAKPQFYLVAVVYMCTRLVVNLTQIYTPLYLVDTLHLPRYSLAAGPLVIFVSGFIVTIILKSLNRVIGRYMAYFLGLALVWGALLWMYAQDGNRPSEGVYMSSVNSVYGATILLGAGGSTLLVTSLSMVADLIGCTVGSSAFVYGLMSFTDKLSNGAAVQTIQALHPCNHGNITCCSGCVDYYRNVVVFVPGGASLLAFVALVAIIIILYASRRQCKDVAPPVCTDPKGTANAVLPCNTRITSIQSSDEAIEDRGLLEECDEKSPLVRHNEKSPLVRRNK